MYMLEDTWSNVCDIEWRGSLLEVRSSNVESFSQRHIYLSLK